MIPSLMMMCLRDSARPSQAERVSVQGRQTKIFNVGEDSCADSSKTRKHVMPENVLSENYVPISRVKLVLYCLRPAQSMNGRNVLDFRPTL